MNAALLTLLLCLHPKAAGAAAQEPTPGSEGIIHFGTDVAVGAGETLEGPAVALGGSVSVEGRVEGPVVALRGDAVLGPKAWVDGPVVALGGEARLAPGARCDGPVVSLPKARILSRIAELLVPLAGTIGAALLFAKASASAGAILAALLLGILFPEALDRTAGALKSRLEVCVAGGLLFWPALAALAVALALTVIGLLVWPFLVLLAAWAWLWGTLALGLRIGEELWGRRWKSPLGRLLTGVALLKALQAVPLIGAVACGLIAVLGVGAAVASGFGLRAAPERRSNP